MIIAQTHAGRIYVNDFDTILACFKSINTNWATNRIPVVLASGVVIQARGFFGISNQNTNQQRIHGAFSWNNNGQLEEIVFYLDRVPGNVGISIQSSLTTMTLLEENIAIRQFLAASLDKIHEKFIDKKLNRRGGGGGIHPLLKAMPRYYNPCNQQYFNNDLGILFTQDFINLANGLRIHFN